MLARKCSVYFMALLSVHGLSSATRDVRILADKNCRVRMHGFDCIDDELNGVYTQMGLAADGRPWFVLDGTARTWLFYDSACHSGPHGAHGWILQNGFDDHELDTSKKSNLFASCNSKHDTCCSLARIEIDSQLPPAGTHIVREYCGHKPSEGGTCQKVSITVTADQSNCTAEEFDGVNDPNLKDCGAFGWLLQLHPLLLTVIVLLMLCVCVCCCGCCCWVQKSKASHTHANLVRPADQMVIVVGVPVDTSGGQVANQKCET